MYATARRTETLTDLGPEPRHDVRWRWMSRNSATLSTSRYLARLSGESRCRAAASCVVDVDMSATLPGATIWH